MKEQITKEVLEENLDRTSQITKQLKLKIESSDDIKNLIENDVNKLRDKIQYIQFNLKSLREKIDLLPESTDEKSELAELENINFQIINIGQHAEAKLKEYFNTSLEYKKEITPLKSKDINKENNIEFQEIISTVFEPLEALSKKNKYIDSNRKTVLTPDRHYLNNIKKLNYKNLEIAISNPKYQYDIISRINFFFEQIRESQYYIQKNIARELSSILVRHKDELKPGKYLPQTEQPNTPPSNESKNFLDDDEEKEENVYNKEDISEKDLMQSIAINLISNKDFSKSYSEKRGLEEILLNNTNENDIAGLFSSMFGYQESKMQDFISIIENNPNSQAYISLENLASKSFEENNYKDIEKYTICTKLAKEKLNNYLIEKYQVPISVFSNSWNFEKIKNASGDVRANLMSMDEIEKSGHGNVKKLVENYGIREFRRYPSEILIKQLEEEDINQPYGVIIYPREDHNNAFDTHKKAYEKLYKDTRGHYGLKIYEVSNKRDIARALIKSEQKYASENKISFMILAGHGETDGMTIGAKYQKNENQSTVENLGNTIDIKDLQGTGIKNVSRFFEKNPQIALVSCSTGAKGGIGQGISKEYGAKVMAPEKPTNLDRISASYDQEGKIKLRVSYREQVGKAYMSGEEIK